MGIEILSGPGCVRCVATKGVFKRVGVEYSEIQTAAPEANGLMTRFADFNGSMETSLPLVVITQPDGTIVDAWSGFDNQTEARLLEAIS